MCVVRCVDVWCSAVRCAVRCGGVCVSVPSAGRCPLQQSLEAADLLRESDRIIFILAFLAGYDESCARSVPSVCVCGASLLRVRNSLLLPFTAVYGATHSIPSHVIIIVIMIVIDVVVDSSHVM